MTTSAPFKSILLVGIGLVLGCRSTPTPATPVESAPNRMVENGTYSAEQFDRLKEISRKVAKQDALEEADFKYVVAQMDAPSKDPGMVRMYVGAILGAIKKPTAGQKEDIRKVASQLLRSADEREQRSGMYIATTSDDPALLKDVLPLTQSANPNTKKKALEFIKRHGG